MRPSFIVIAIGLAALLCGTRAVHAEEIVFGALDTPPFVIHGEPGEPDTGVYPELLQLLARTAGLQARIDVMPLSRVIVEMAMGRTQAGIILQSERFSPDLIPVRPIGEFETVVIPRRGLGLESLDDLRGKSIVQLRGGHYAAQLRPESSGETGIKLYELSRSSLLPNFVQSGRADAMAGTLLGLQYSIREAGLTPADFGQTMHLNMRMAWLFLSSRARADETELNALRDRLGRAVDELKADGSIDLILQRYTVIGAAQSADGGAGIYPRP